MGNWKVHRSWGGKAAPMALVFGVMLSLLGAASANPGPSPKDTVDLAWVKSSDLDRLMARQRMEKRQLLKESLALQGPKLDEFWPLYYAYQGALIDLYDQKLALIARFDADYPAIPPSELDALISRYLTLKAQQIRLLDVYFHRISKRFDPGVASRFVQIESAWNGSFDLKLIERLPLAPGATVAPPRP